MSASLVKQSLEIVDTDLNVKKKKTRPSKEKKYSVQEAKKTVKSKKELLKKNLEKLELIRRNCQIILDEDTTRNITERAITNRPINTYHKKSTKSETAFSEEDFTNFEKEYMNS